MLDLALDEESEMTKSEISLAQWFFANLPEAFHTSRRICYESGLFPQGPRSDPTNSEFKLQSLLGRKVGLSSNGPENIQKDVGTRTVMLLNLFATCVNVCGASCIGGLYPYKRPLFQGFRIMGNFSCFSWRHCR